MSKGMRLHIPSSFNYHLKIMTLDSTKQREPFCEFQLNWQVIAHSIVRVATGPLSVHMAANLFWLWIHRYVHKLSRIIQVV